MGVEYELVSGSNPSNISCGALSFPCSRILLTIDGDKASLLLEPNTSTQGLTAVYLVGDFNNWNYMSTTGKLTLDTDDNLFKGQVGLTAGDEGLSHWMIYQRLALAGAWGLENNATSALDKGELLAGKTGHVASKPGMYDITFNLQTGEFTLSELPSQAAALTLSPSSAVIVPKVPEKVKVLSLNNSLIHYNDQAKVFNEIADAMGKDASWTKHTNLGKTLQYHWEEGDGMTDAGEPGAKMMIRSDAWSHIILQEQTALPRTDFSSFSQSVKQWVEYIRENCPNPNAVIILPLNWALGQDWTNFTEYNKQLVENYTKVAQEYGVVISPIGLAYQAKFNKDGGPETEKSWFLPGDDRHPTLKATYLAALLQYALIFNEDPTKVTYYPNYKTEYDQVGEMSDEIAAEMRQYAKNAFEAYDNVVNHHAGTISLKAAVIDQFDMEMPDQNITWSVTPSSASIQNGVFIATENGEYTVKATAGDFSSTAIIKVADAETEVPNIDFIGLSQDNLQYSQDFDSMGYKENDETDDYNAPIPSGWRADGQLTERTLGTYNTANTETLKSSHGQNFGSTVKNGVWNFGDSSHLSDRALGGATTDAQGGAKSINIYAAFKNTGSKAISSLDITYDVEKYRNGSNTAGFTIQLYTSVDGRNWTSAGDDFKTVFAADATTAGADVTPIESRTVTGDIDLNMVPGTELFLAWNISASTGTSCMSAPLLAIDNFSINATLKPVPVFDNYIYIEDNSGYEKTGLYAWGDGEIFGAWPGQNPIDIVEIDGTTYQVFGHNQASGTYSIIFNNNNNGSQYNDFAIQGGADYYIRAKSDGKTLELISDTTGISDIQSEEDQLIIIITDNTVSCNKPVELSVITPAGMIVKQAIGHQVNISDLVPGLYIATAFAQNGNKSVKFIKR